MDLFSRIKDGLQKTRNAMLDGLRAVTTAGAFDDEFYEDLEGTLIQADLGVETTMALVDQVREDVREGRLQEPAEVPEALQDTMSEMLAGPSPALQLADNGLTVITVVGVNGVGKTTTIGKLGRHLQNQGREVLLAAADTFRAAAVEQLEKWGSRIDADVISHQEGSDPASVAYDGLQAARARGRDVVIVDTAGRLHTKKNLMTELQKIHRVLGGEHAGAPHETLLVLDATTGQNAVQQVRLFADAVPVSGLVLTKLDGTAKGGIVVSVANQYEIPVKFIGTGESIHDLQAFDSRRFVRALFGAE